LLTRLISFSFMWGRWEIVRGENLIADFPKIRSLSIPSRTRIFLLEFIMRWWEMRRLLMLINRAHTRIRNVVVRAGSPAIYQRNWYSPFIR
jgi:hypothetical protein